MDNKSIIISKSLHVKLYLGGLKAYEYQDYKLKHTESLELPKNNIKHYKTKLSKWSFAFFECFQRN